MARLKFNGIAIGNARGFATTAKSTTGTVADGIATIQRCMQSEVASRNNIAYRLTSIQTSVSQVESDIQAIYQTVDNATANYNNAERQIVVLAQQIANGYRPNNYSSNRDAFAAKKFDKLTRKAMLDEKIANQGMKTSEERDFDAVNKMFDVAGKFGVAGSAINSVGKVITGIASDDKYQMGKSFVNVGKNMFSTIGSLAANTSTSTTTQSLKKVLRGDWEGNVISKLDKASSIYKYKTKWGNANKDYIDNNYKFKKTNADGTVRTVGDNVKVGTKWAGVALSLIGNGIDNYEEYARGEIDADRARLETISETVVDVAVDVVVTGAATAIVGTTAAALGFASAPVVLVGVVAVGITWGLDATTELLTDGKEGDFTEAASDFVIDTVSDVTSKIGIKWEKCFG